MRALALCLILAASPALADTISIPGPDGPLEGEAIAVAGAAHALVIIPGSGPTDRDGNGPDGMPGLRSDTYRMLAEALEEAGVASIRIDKRGLFGSTAALADPWAARIDGYAEDARGWVAAAARLAPCIWLAGHSEGGLVALVAAQEPPANLCGLILLSTPGSPLGEILRAQLAANPATAPLSAEIDAVLAQLEAGALVPEDQIPPGLDLLFGPQVQPYLIDILSRDPVALAQNYDGPALVVQGARDLQVGPEDAERLVAALSGAEALPLPEATHMLKPDQPGLPMATYLNPTLPLDPALVPGIIAFLDRHPPR